MKYLALALSFLVSQFSLAFIGEMPQEIKLEIAKKLGLEDLARLSSTSKEMRKALNPRWKSIFLQNLRGLNQQDQKSYLTGEEKTDNNIDWKEAFLDIMSSTITNNTNILFRKQSISGKNSLSKEYTRKRFLINVNFAGMNLSSYSFYHMKLDGANLENTNLNNAIFLNSEMSTTNLSAANLTKVYMNEVDLVGANLSNTKLIEANLFNCNLFRANLSHADLTLARLNNSNLSDANLTNATLSTINLDGVKLLRTNFSGTKIRSCFYMENKKIEYITLEWLKIKGAIWDPENPPIIQ